MQDRQPESPDGSTPVQRSAEPVCPRMAKIPLSPKSAVSGRFQAKKSHFAPVQDHFAPVQSHSASVQDRSAAMQDGHAPVQDYSAPMQNRVAFVQTGAEPV